MNQFSPATALVKKITLLNFLFFIAVHGILSNPEVFVCPSLLLVVAKKIVNKTSSLFEKGYGFVCLLIFQSGTSSRIFCFSARMALHMRRPWRAGSRVAHTAMALHMRRPWRAGSRVAHKGDGATHAEAMDGRESRKPGIFIYACS